MHPFPRFHLFSVSWFLTHLCFQLDLQLESHTPAITPWCLTGPSESSCPKLTKWPFLPKHCSFWMKHCIIFSLSLKSRTCHVLILLFIMPLSKWIWTSVYPTFSLSPPLLSWHFNSLALVQDIILSYLVFCDRSLIGYPDSSLPLPLFSQSTTHPTASRLIFLKCKPYCCLAENSNNSCYRIKFKLFNIS